MPAGSSVLAAGCAAILVCGCGEAGGQSSQGSAGTSAPAAASSSVAAGSNASDTCSLVTKSDAEIAFGEAAGSSKSHQTAVSSICSYTSLSGSARLVVDISHWPDAATASSKYQGFRSIGQPISGLGDQARGNDGILEIQKGRVLVNIVLLLAAKQPDPAAAMKSLAAKLLGSL